MVENLIELFTELSREFVRHELGIVDNEFEFRKKERVFNTCVSRLRKKCFDVLLRKYPGAESKDPCKTSYGADWNPLILLLDYGGELKKYGAEAAYRRLIANIQVLQSKDFTCLKEMYKLMFLLKGSFSEFEVDTQPDFLKTVSQYSLFTNGPYLSMDDRPIQFTDNEMLPSKSLCNECTTNLFESGLSLLNMFSNRNMPVQGKLSAKFKSVSMSQISSNQFTTSDFSASKRSCSISSFLKVANDVCTSDHSLWDNFVEKPISHRLQRSSVSKNDYFTCNFGSNNKFCSIPNMEIITMYGNYWTDVCDDEISEKVCEEDDSTNLYFYPILKENCLKTQTYESCFIRKSSYKLKTQKQRVKNSFFQSSITLILALWEQEHKLLYSYSHESAFSLPNLRIIDLSQYLKDVQFLLIGIFTNSFRIIQDQMIFQMEKGTCLEGVTPGTLQSFSKEYMEMGLCYIRLSYHTHMNLKNQMMSDLKDCRIIYKVFWMSVFDYLCNHCRYVLRIPVSLGLLEFKAYVKNLYPIITSVAEVCKVSVPHSVLPQGGQLLTYLIQAVQKITNKNTADVFFGFLKSCCEVYLLQLLQSWMFQGHLDRHHWDFFVEHRPKNPRCKDRSYYLSFYMFSDRIPSFLKGLENNIFNCGKTVHLLKLIQPESKLCRLLDTKMYPKMKLCLTEKEILEQRRRFEDYAKNVKKICGKFASIASLKREAKSRETLYEKYIFQVKKEQQTRRELKMKETREEQRRIREEQKLWLKQQIEHAAEEKRRRREEEELESRSFFEKVRLIAQEEKKLVEEEKRNMKMYYKELFDHVDKRKISATTSWKQRSDQLNKKNARFKPFRSSEEISCDTRAIENPADENCQVIITDEEGNIISSETSNAPNFNSTATTETSSKVTPPTFDNLTDKINEIRSEDIANENISEDELSSMQLDNLITSRKDYEERLEHDTNSNTVQYESKAILGASEVKRNEHGLGNGTEVVETEAQKNKKKIMSSEFGLEVKKIPETVPVKYVMSDLQKNRQKVLASEFDINNQEVKESTKIEKPGVETEAQRIKKKILQCEFQLGSSNTETKSLPVLKAQREETEAERNKKKVMSTEFNLHSGPEEKKVEVVREETEAQRNKRKAMECEFGYPANESKVGVTCRSVVKQNTNLTEAQKNKQKFYETEYGYQSRQQLESVISTTSGTVKDPDLDLLDLNDDEGYYGTVGKVRKTTSFAEKALQIYNKRKQSEDDMKFFCLKENILEQTDVNNYARFDFNEIQILFEQNGRGALQIDKTLVGDLPNDMDVTTFTNCVRRSVLIPLQVQEEIANEALFNHLLKEENMLSHFNSLRNYFFLNDGEFSRRLTQNIFVTLAKCTEPHQFFKRSTLNQIVYEALNYTIHGNEPNTQNVSFEIIEMPEVLSHSSHNVLAPFELSYQVKWPLNIILTERALSKYKLVFHFLLKLKRINWTLNENFSFLTYTYKNKRINGKALLNSSHYHKIHIYRHAMGQFMRTLENYISACSLQFSWMNFQKDLETAKNLDHLYEKHVRYIKEVLKRCFLTKESVELLNHIHILIELSLKFHYATISGKWIVEDGKYEHSKFQVLKITFNEFCNLTKEFLRTLRKKISSHYDLKPHEILVEKFEIILR